MRESLENVIVACVEKLGLAEYRSKYQNSYVIALSGTEI